MDIFNKNLIAFQYVDTDNDISLLFESEKEVVSFFENPSKLLEILELEMDEDNGEYIDSFISIFATGETINAVRINLEYCGEKWIKRMAKGVVIRDR